MLEPKINNHLKVVVGGLIYQNKKILICQRKEEGDHPLKWEFPGGKVKELEDNPKIITKFEPLIWLAFIALTAVVGCPIF